MEFLAMVDCMVSNSTISGSNYDCVRGTHNCRNLIIIFEQSYRSTKKVKK